MATGTAEMPASGKSSFREEYCPSHLQVEWEVSYETLQNSGDAPRSPVFKIGRQSYMLESKQSNTDGVELFLLRMGPSISDRALEGQFWGGLKRTDGDYDLIYDSRQSDLKCEFITFNKEATFCISFTTDLDTLYLTADGCLKFFLRMNVKRPLVGVETCMHDTPDDIVPQATGNIREEQCSSHKQVEWEIGYKLPRDGPVELTSPVFKIGTQAYFFEICFETHGSVGLRLFRIGRCVRGPASTPHCWVGLKRVNGTLYYEKISKQVDLREDFWLWTHLDYLKRVWANEVRERYLTQDSKLTFLFRMNTETIGQQMCTHGLTEVPSSVTGRIREVGCSSHKEVEWGIDCEVLRERNLSLKSPVFRVDTQMYYWELVGKINYNAVFILYRLGRSVEGPASSFRCWAGLKYPDGSYPLRNASRILDLHDDFALWTFVTSFMQFKDVKLDDNALKYMHRLIFFFRMSVEPPGTEKCIHGPIDSHATSGEGSIQIQECTTHKHVVWDVKYEASRKKAYSSKSPDFEIGNQWYQLDVYYDGEEPVVLELHRSGYPVQGPASSVRCWAGLKTGDASYHHHHTQMAEVDISEEFSLPTVVASFDFPGRSDLERAHVTSEGSLTFWLQMNVPQATVDESTCVHGAVEMCPPGEGSIRERNENLVEWDVDYEEPREYTHFSTSPVFKMGIQRYLLDLCYEVDGILALSLYRFGRSVEALAGPVRCWAGLKRDRGMYHHNIEGVELDLRRDCELWTEVGILGNFRRCDLEDECLTKNGRLTFFCLINAEGRESKAVAVQTDENRKDGHEHRLSRHSEDFKKLRQDFRLWLEHPEEGDSIRRRRREEFEAKRWNALEKQLKKDTEPSIFAA